MPRLSLRGLMSHARTLPCPFLNPQYRYLLQNRALTRYRYLQVNCSTSSYDYRHR